MRIAECAIDQGKAGERGPYIIAEIGVNHDGDPTRALALTDAAARCGADAIKLQYFETDRLLSKDARLAGYQRDAGESDPAAMLRRLEIDLESCSRVIERAHALGLHALVTIFSLENADAALALPWDALKAASPDLINKPLLDVLVADGRPLIISTGAATVDEIARSRAWLDGASDRLAFLHCVSSYPTPPADAQLAACAHLAELVSPCPVGYSDHTAMTETGAVAAACAGAVILEKHLTDDRARPGPDHAASLDESGFTAYVKDARSGAVPADGALVRSMLGSGRKALVDREADVRALSRQSLVPTHDLPKGHVLRRGDLTVKRPGTGVEPWRLDEIVGQELASAVRADEPLPHAAV
jgi:N,N'-diacetyllegionaminate synthase